MDIRTGGDDTFFQVGGRLPAESSSYVEREADSELLAATRAGEFCYVLTTHQMGKSSLIERTAHRLRLGDDGHAGCSIAVVDMRDICKFTIAESWYFGFLENLCERLGLEFDLEGWWPKVERLPFADRLLQFYRDVLLAQTTGQVVVFVDEIESTLRLKFADDFFAAVRACCEARSTQPVFRRLGFVIAGVASPADLIKDPALSPFPLGRAIPLNDFTAEQAASLMRGLAEDEPTQKRILQQVIFWTRGHPYLTQKLCQLIRGKKSKRSTEEIDELVHEVFLIPNVRKTDESNLRFVHDRLAGKNVSAWLRPRRRAVLLAYRKIKLNNELHVEAVSSTVREELRLWGTALPDVDGLFFVRNPIYDQVFGSKWIRRYLPASRTAILVSLSIGILLTSLTVYIEWTFPRELIAALRTAADDTTQIDELQHAYEQLRRIPFYESRADQEWGNFAQRRAQRAIQGDNFDPDPRYYQLALRARKQIESWTIETARQQWDDASREWLAQFYDQRGIRSMGVDGEQGSAALWALAASSTQNNENRWKTFQDYSRGCAALERTFRMEFDVQHLKWTSDGQLVIVGSRGDNVYVNDVFKARQHVLITPSDVRLLEASPDGRRTVSLSGANYVRLWDSQTADPPIPLRTPGDVTYLALSTDGSRVLTVTNDQLAQFWNAETGAEDYSLKLATDSLMNAALSPDGGRLVTVAGNGIVTLLDVATGVEQWRLTASRPAIIEAVFSPNGGHLLFQTDGGRLVSIVNAKTGVEVQKLDLTSPATSPDGSHVVGIRTEQGFGSEERELSDSRLTDVAIFDLANIAAAAPTPLISVWPPALFDDINDVKLSLGPNAMRMVASSNSHTQVLDASTGDVVISVTRRESDRPATRVAATFSPDGDQVAIETEDNVVQVWRTSASEPQGIRLIGHSQMVWTTAFSRDGTRLVTGGYDGTAKVWNTASGRETRSLEVGSPPIWTATFAPDGESVACIGGLSNEETTAGLFKLATGRKSIALEGLAQQPNRSSNQRMAFNTAGDLIAYADMMWNAKSGKKEFALSMLPEETVGSFAFSPDDALVAGTMAFNGKQPTAKTVRVWDAKTGREHIELENVTEEFFSLSFDPQGTLLVGGGMDGLSIWDLQSGKTLSRLEDSTESAVVGLTFSPDGSRLLTLSRQLIREYDWNNGDPKLCAAWPAEHGLFWSQNFAIQGATDTFRVVEAGNLLTPTIREIARSLSSPKSLPPPDSEYSLPAWEQKFGLQIRSDGTIAPLND